MSSNLTFSPALQPSQTIQDHRTIENETKELSQAKQASIISTIDDFARTITLFSFSSTAENKAQIKIGTERVSIFLKTLPPASASGPLKPLIELVNEVVTLSANNTFNLKDHKRRQKALAEIIQLTQDPSLLKKRPIDSTISSFKPLSEINLSSLYQDAYSSYTPFLLPKEIIALSKAHRQFTAFAATVRAQVKHLELVGEQITDEYLSHALQQHPGFNSIRLEDLSLTAEGILALAKVLKGRSMRSIELIRCGYLLHFPKAARTLIEQISFEGLERFAISEQDDFDGIDSDMSPLCYDVQAYHNFMKECGQPLANKLSTSLSLRTLDLSLLKTEDLHEPEKGLLNELFQSLPTTLETFGPFPTPPSGELLVTAMRKINPQNILRCDLSKLEPSEVPIKQFREIIAYLPFAQMTHICISTEMVTAGPSYENQIFEEVLLKLPTCQQLKQLRMGYLSAEQTRRLIPVLPGTLEKLGPLTLNEEAVDSLIAKDFKAVKGCKLKMEKVSAEKARDLLASLPLETMDYITLAGPFEEIQEQELIPLLDQIKRNKNLRKLKISFGSTIYSSTMTPSGKGVADILPRLLESIQSSQIQALHIYDHANQAPKNLHTTIKELLLKNIDSWPQIKDLLVLDCGPLAAFTLASLKKG